jgi:hypothetical protein
LSVIDAVDGGTIVVPFGDALVLPPELELLEDPLPDELELLLLDEDDPLDEL